MSQGELLIEYGWVIALIVSIGVISWTVLLLQALMHDKRIALVGVFGSLLVAFVAVFPDLIPFADGFKLAAGVVCMLFLLWFVFNHIKRPVVFLPLIGLALSALVGFRLYQAYLLAA